MTPDDASGQVAPAGDAPTRRAARLWYVLAGFLFVFLGGSILLWLLRKPAAEQALAAWCGSRDLQCDAKFTELDTSGITVSAVKVTSGAAVPAEASEIRANIRWTGLFTPEVTGVTVDGLSLRGTLDASGLKFGGLERLIQSNGSGGAAPPVEIRDARILIDTPAGQANATLNVLGALPRDGTLSVRIDPGSLADASAHADLREGRLDVRAKDGDLEAELRLGIDTAAYSDYGVEAFDLLARAEFGADAGKPLSVEWSLRADRIASPDLRATDIRSAGRAAFAARPALSINAALSKLAGAGFDGQAASLTVSGYTFDTAQFDGELAGRAGEVSGPLIVSTGVATGPAGSARALSLAGEIARGATGTTGFEGKLSVNGAALDEGLRRRAGAAFSLPGVLAGHADALRGALSRALSDFETELGVSAQTDGRAFTASAMGEASLVSTSGFRLKVTPGEDKAWVKVSKDAISGQGKLSLSGGGAPSVSMDLKAFTYTPADVSLKAETLNLDTWSVGGRSLGAALQGITLDRTTGELLVSGSGTLSFAGEAAGVRFAPTKISGGLEAANNESGWRVQSVGAPCLAVDTEGFRIGAISVAPADLDVCPVKGRFMRQGPVPGGAAELGQVRLPFTMESGDGVLSLKGAAIDWTVGQAFALTVRASALDMPLKIGERTLTIDGDAPRIDLKTGKGPAQIAARLGKTVFGGTLVPANVSAAAFTFDGVSAATGIKGDVAGSGVLITDINADPIYKPIAAEFTGTVGDNRLRLTGPLRLKAAGVPLAEAAVDLDLLTLNGEATVTSRPLNFRPGGLQPDMISGRLTGFFTSASGRVNSEARFTIRRGTIDGTADVRVQNFGFQTTQLGRVDGVNGTINFTDVMAMTTAPAQVFSVAQVNPGIPLADGRIVFELREKGILHLDTVQFPFGGGTLAIAPFDWALEGGNKDQKVEVTAQAIGLTQLVEILKLPDTIATGTVSGKFPIEFAGSSVRIKDARLQADDPGGRLSYTGGAAEAAAGQDANASLAFSALRDLKFNVLEIGIDGDLAGDLRADILLAGENINPLPVGNGVTLPAGQAFEFAIGFDLPVGKLIENNLGLVSQEDVIDAAMELLMSEPGTTKNGGTPPADPPPE